MRARNDLNVRKFYLTVGADSKLEEVLMNTLTITAKGQVTLRKDLLRHLGVEPGEKIEINNLQNFCQFGLLSPPRHQYTSALVSRGECLRV